MKCEVVILQLYVRDRNEARHPFELHAVYILPAEIVCGRSDDYTPTCPMTISRLFHVVPDLYLAPKS